MQVISKASGMVLTILRKSKVTDCAYRKMHYCVETPVEEGVLIHNLVTKELVLLSKEEYENCLDMEYLREHWFVVPEDTNDKEYVDVVKLVLSNQQKKDKQIVDYTIFTTTDCNARCFYCFERGRSRIPMTKETALKVVQYIKKHCGGKSVRITWFGGEPLYNQEAIDTICTGLREQEIDFSSKMVSNAYLFDADVVRKAVELWNLKQIQITLDGTETTYNRIKAYIYKEGNPYQIVLRNIERILDADIKVSVRLNMDLYNAENLLELAKELSPRFGGRKGISVYAHHIFKDNESMADTYTAEEWEKRNAAMSRIEECLLENNLTSRGGISKKFNLNHCMADNDKAITILPDGHIGVCEQCSESEFIGHIDTEGFNADVVRSWKEKTPPIKECATCFNYPDCILLKKCPNSSKCFLQHRQGRHRAVCRQMLNEYQRWRDKSEEHDDDTGEFC